ncbi:MAG: hypothetical protein WAT39_15680 [Planctomycetota bacterium]
MTATESTPHADAWAAQLEQLRARYKHVRPPILAALNILIHDENIAVDDAKAKAATHGVRITAASVSAARTLLARMDAQTIASNAPAANGTATPAARPRPTARVRVGDGGVDADALIRQVVAKLQNQSSVEAERVRDGIRRAIAILQGLVGVAS